MVAMYVYTLYFVEVVVFIAYIGGQEKLLCSHETLHLSLLHPTVYTQITGMNILIK